MTKRATYSLLLLALLFAAESRLAAEPGLSAQDVAAVRAANAAYPAAWLKNDKAAVKKLFTDDAVLLPAGGLAPIRGAAAIDSFFWPPDSPPFPARCGSGRASRPGGAPAEDDFLDSPPE